MSEKKNNASVTGKKAGKVIFEGRFFSLEFFKRNWVYVVFVMAMALAYIALSMRRPTLSVLVLSTTR